MSSNNRAFKRYSLTDYTVSILPANSTQFKLTLGGTGSFLGSIGVTWDSDIWSKEVDVTGSGVYSKNYDRSGEIKLVLNQMSEKVKTLEQIMRSYYAEPGGTDVVFDITIKSAALGRQVIAATHCVLKKLPDLEYGEAATTREFTFLAMKIMPIVN